MLHSLFYQLDIIDDHLTAALMEMYEKSIAAYRAMGREEDAREYERKLDRLRKEQEGRQ